MSSPIKADTFSYKLKQSEVYSDFKINFDLNPITGFLARTTNEESIKQSLKTLLLTRRTERVYDSHCGSRLHALLFEPMDSVTENTLKNEILETIMNNEPRVTNVEVQINQNQDEDSYNVAIYFSIINIPDRTFSLNLILNRVR